MSEYPGYQWLPWDFSIVLVILIVLTSVGSGNVFAQFGYNDAPLPVIDASLARHVMAGSSFVLDCTVHTNADMLVDLSWEFPSNATSSRAQSNVTLALESGDRIIRNRLTVSGVDNALDNGVYCCVSKKLSDGQQRQASVSIRPFPAGVDSHLVLIPQYPVVEVMKDSSAALSVKWDAHPTPSIQWKRNGEDLQGRERFTYDTRKDSAHLLIVSTLGEDAGNYTLEATAGNTSAAVTFHLRVNEAPTVELVFNSEFKPFFHVDRYVESGCTVTAYPPANVTWSFQPCQNTCTAGDVQTNGIWIKVPDQEISIRGNVSARTVRILFRPTAGQLGSGFLRCKAVNSFGTRLDMQRVIASDVEGGFLTEMMPDNPVENQDISMKCLANEYGYSTVRWEWQSSLQSADYITVRNGDPFFRLENSRTSYSHVLTLVIPSASSSLNGYYRCVAVSRSSLDTVTYSTPIKLDLIRATSPQHAKHVADDQVVSRTVSYRGTLRLDCTATGSPPPVYRWTRDMFGIEPSGGIHFEQGRAVLIHDKMTQDDGGYYSCNASNSAGYLTKRWVVKVNGSSAAEEEQTLLIASICVGCVFLVLMSVLAVLCCRLRKVKQEITVIPLLRRTVSSNP